MPPILLVTVSELGLAQSENSFPTTNSRQKDRDLPYRLFIGNGVSISRQEEGSSVLEGRRKALERGLSATRDFWTLYYEDRRPLYCATESHRRVSSGLFLGLLEARFEWNMRGWLRRESGDSCAMLCSPSLLFLIEIPLRRRPYGRRKGDARS